MIGFEQSQSILERHPPEIRKRFWGEKKEKRTARSRDTLDRTGESAREVIEILSRRWISLIATPVLLLRI